MWSTATTVEAEVESPICVSVKLLGSDDLIGLDLGSVETILDEVRTAVSRLGGYEAEVVDAVEVLRRRARPKPPDPPDDDQDTDDDTDDEEARKKNEEKEEKVKKKRPAPKPSGRQREEARKRAARMRHFPKVGAALKRGLINIEQADLLTRSGLSEDKINELLTEAMLSDSADATRVAVREAIREANEVSPELWLLGQQNARRFSHGVDEHGDGGWWFYLRVDPLVGQAILDRFEKAEKAEWQHDDKTNPDRRTGAQRRADAFAGLILNGSTPAPKKGKLGGMPEVGAHLVIDVENMLKLAVGDRGAVAWTLNGTQVPASQWQKLVDGRAEIFAWVLSADGLEMDLGRSTRNATEVQKFAMAIRDGTCTSQDCDRSPGACDAHHLIEWTEQHGPTDIALMALQCPVDHTNIHKMGANLVPGDKPGEWRLVQEHTGKTIKTWTNHLPPWR